ncbi:MAG: transcriptional regulator [Paenibacillaceae bacterium]|jgi:LCP family protein required for cell wall assembly|nr:transcriptional regulator [Paenibacillaceae bacterium]
MTRSDPLSGGQESESRRRSGKPRKIAFAFVWMAVLAVVGTIGYGAYLYVFKLTPMLGKIGTDQSVPAGMAASEKPMVLLLLGTDFRPKTGSLNTDVIMVAALNPGRKSATVVSIPRDTYLKASQGLRANKANAFYPNLMASSKSTAPDKIKKVFAGALGVPVDYVATVNFQGFRDIVDAVGGVKVEVDMDMRYVDKADGTNINLTEGLQTLDGKNALDFVRYRKSNNGTSESSDQERNARQQMVVAELLHKLKTPAGVLAAGDLMEAVGEHITTDIPVGQLKSMIRTYIGIDKDKMEYIHLEGEWKSPYVYISDKEWKMATAQLKQQLE